MPDIFDLLDTNETVDSKSDIFDRIPEPQEGFWKSSARTALQIPQGIAEATGPGIATGLMHMMGVGEALDPEEIEHIRMVSEREGIPFDEEKYREAANQAGKYFPTVSNIGREIEERTGLPLEPKTKIQKMFRLGSTAGKFQPGTLGEKATAAVAAPIASQALQQTGLPEELSDIVGLGVGGVTGSKGPKVDIGKSTKPSGLTKRQFEGLKEPKEVSAGKIEQINQKLENDFKSISDKIIKESAVGETFENLKNDPSFKNESRELLNQAQVMADSIPGTLPSKGIKKEIADMAAKKTKGYSLSEYDKSYLNHMKESIDDIIPENVTHGELVEQYRKNNASLSEYFEPGSSKAQNRAKRDALLDNNRVIANVIEKTDPKLSEVFKEGNARWTKIMDAEAVDSFVSELFTEKVNYKKMHDFFDKNGYDRIFKRALGEAGYKSFEQLMKDMLSSEAPYKMLKVAKEKGFMDLAKTVMAYKINPNLGYAKVSLDAGQYLWKSTINSLLDKPKLALTWKKGIDSLKKGNFKSADTEFKTLKGEILEAEKPTSKQSTNETINITPEKTNKTTTEIKSEKIEPKRLEEPKKQIDQRKTEKSKLPVTIEEFMEAVDNGTILRGSDSREAVEIILSTTDDKMPISLKRERLKKLDVNPDDVGIFEQPKKQIEYKQPDKQKTKFTTENRKNGNFGEIEVFNIDKKIVAAIDYSISSDGIGIEHIFSNQPGAAKHAFIELLEKFPDKDIIISPMTEKGAKAFEKELGHRIEPRIIKGENIRETLQRPRIDYKLTEADKEKILGIHKQKKPEIKSEISYGREDFPTKKEAQEYLDHIEKSLKKSPQAHKKLLQRDIKNLEEIISGFEKEEGLQFRDRFMEQSTGNENRELNARKKANIESDKAKKESELAKSLSKEKTKQPTLEEDIQEVKRQIKETLSVISNTKDPKVEMLFKKQLKSLKKNEADWTKELKNKNRKEKPSAKVL